jgi:hypothetical protein
VKLLSCALIACGGVLVLLAAIIVFQVPVGCLFVPCDRSFDIRARVEGPAAEEAAAGHCKVELGEPGAGYNRDSFLSDGVADFVIGPFRETYQARVLCRGFEPTPWRPVKISDDADSFDLGSVRPGPGWP